MSYCYFSPDSLNVGITPNGGDGAIFLHLDKSYDGDQRGALTP